MKPSIRTILLSTALTVPVAAPVLAQDDSAEACSTLEQVLQSDRVASAEVDDAAIEDAIASGNAEECQSWIVELREQGIDSGEQTEAAAEGDQASDDQASDGETQQADESAEAEAQAEAEGQAVASEQTTVRLEDEAVIAGTVYLEQSPPTVDIQGGDAEVDVSSAPPDVTVREGQAEIVVRQASPTITIDMPQPTIRIEQPAPEIIITMPEPGVDVASQRPQVEVRQADPTITVTQAQPRVDLELRAAEEGEEASVQVSDRATGESYQMGQAGDEREVSDAQVNMTSNQPVVNYTEGDQQANVSIERSEPTVTYESAEPQVEISSAGEPQVEWSQTGEATVTFQEASAEQAEGSDETQSAEADPATEEEAEAGDAVAAAEQSAEEASEAADEAQQVASEAEAMAEGEEGEATAEADQAAETEQTEEEVAAADEPATTEEVGGAEDLASTDEAQATEEMSEEDMAAAETTEGTTGGSGPAVEREGYNLVSVDQVQVETLTGSSLYGVNDEEIGDVGDLVLSDDGQIQSVIVEVGGFLGIGQKEVSVPFDMLTILQSEAGDVRVYADLTQEELEQMEEAN